MVEQSTIDGLLEGAFDTHIHSAPDVLPRKFNDLELAQRFKARRMAGFVLKSHYICTADRATLVNQVVPEIQAFGAIALNNSVGGLNPLALDIAGRLGTRVCWLPSVDNANELEAIAGQRDESKLPYWMSIAREMRALGIAGAFLSVTEDGKVTHPVKGATLIGNGPDALTRVSMIGNDMSLDSGVGTCGKEGQSVPVGVGQPTLRIDGLTVGGTA